MTPLQGFPSGKAHLTPIPGDFFAELLPEIDHLGELKVTLYAFWRLDRMEGKFRFLKWSDFVKDTRFMKGMGRNLHTAEVNLGEALERAEGRGTLLRATIQLAEEEETFYFLNTPQGQAAVEAIRQGKWRPVDNPQATIELGMERPNVFRLYEENIGPLTPMIADRLREAETTYPLEWLEDAIRIAVENNKRSWSYVEAILRSWQEKGRDEQDRRDTEKDRRRYIEGEFSDIIKH